MTTAELSSKVVSMSGEGHAPASMAAADRAHLVEKIVITKLAKGLKWADVAAKIGRSKEWTAAACLGQMAMDADEAAVVAEIFGLSEFEKLLLRTVPYKGSLPTAVPTDPLIYRFYEIVQVYGTTIKALIEEEFGDGIMSAIDFTMDIDRKADPKGDRVVVTLDGKFLSYKKW